MAMKTYTIEITDMEIRARSHRDCYRQLCEKLKVEGPRALVAQWQAIEIRASLYEGESYIRHRSGRLEIVG